jgi:hypothetical protein
MQTYLFDRLMEAGEPLGLTLVGARAQNWLRQEKSYRAFGTELGRDATPLEAGLDRFVDLGKDFHGKAAMEATGIRVRCVTLLVDGPEDADPWGREALYTEDGTRTGRLTSGGWSVAFGARSAWATSAPSTPPPAPGCRSGCRPASGPPRSPPTAPTTPRTPASAPTSEPASWRRWPDGSSEARHNPVTGGHRAPNWRQNTP